jgi:proline-specific peptidase
MRREGFVSVEGGRVWYEVVGSGDAIPLLTLHGGPGYPHDYLEPLEELSSDRPVVFYDQLGCGKSDRPADPALWHAERFVRELAQVRSALGLKEMHLLGQSWGGMLATDYVLTGVEGVRSLILASAPLSIPRWVEDMSRLRSGLPVDVQEVYNRHESAGFTACLEYQAAMLHFYRRHVCRLDPWPECLERAVAELGIPVYSAMWGPSEFFVTGNLLDYDRTARLGEITIPTLFTCGRFDEATPESTTFFQGLVPGSELAIFEQSAHCAHIEEKPVYLQLVRDFMHRAESALRH